MVKSYQNLTLKDKISFLDMVKQAAPNGPEAVWNLLSTLEISIRETDIRGLLIAEYGWTEGMFHELWVRSNENAYPLFSL